MEIEKKLKTQIHSQLCLKYPTLMGCDLVFGDAILVNKTYFNDENLNIILNEFIK